MSKQEAPEYKGRLREITAVLRKHGITRGVPPEKLRLIQLHAGGTFGYKFSPTIEALVGVAALVTGRPVAPNFNM